jgi:hypothetical protein
MLSCSLGTLEWIVSECFFKSILLGKVAYTPELVKSASEPPMKSAKMAVVLGREKRIVATVVREEGLM